jgi:DNA primase
VIPPAFVHDLLSRVDIVEIVGRSVDLKRAGTVSKGLCPFHGEKSPSFTVSASRQTYHCFGCGVHGNAIGFLMEQHGMGFVDAVKDLAQQAGMTVPEDTRSAAEREQAVQQRQRQATLEEVLAKAAESYRRQLKASPRAIAYLKGRGLTGEIAARYGLGYAPEGWRGLASVFPSYDDPLLEESGSSSASARCRRRRSRRSHRSRAREAIRPLSRPDHVPIRAVQGAVIGFGGRVLDRGEPKYLNSPETPVFVKGRELYGLFEGRTAIRQRGYALVVEGYMDVVALAQSGFGNAVATLGTACTAEHVQKLVRFTDAVVFSFDGDAAGRRAAARAPRGEPAARDRHPELSLPVPAARARSRQLCPRARRRGVRAAGRGRGAALPADRRAGRRGARLRHRRGPGPLPRQRPAALDRAARRHAEAPAARRDRIAGGAGDRRARGALARRRTGARVVRHRPLRHDRPDSGDRDGRCVRRSASRTTASPGCCSSRTPGGTPLGAADHALLCALPGWHGEAFRFLDRETAEHGRQPWAACASASPRSPGARPPWRSSTARTRRSSRCSTTCTARWASCGTADQKRAAARVLGPHRLANRALAKRTLSRRTGYNPLFSRSRRVTAAPPGPGHPLNEGFIPRPPFPARTAQSDGDRRPSPRNGSRRVGTSVPASRAVVAFALERP